MPESGRDCVVAGFDLSDASRRAVWWAAAEAASRHRPLLLVHVFVWPFAELTQVTVPGQREIMEPLKDALRRELQTLVAGCRELAPDVDVRDDMPFGDPAEELAAKAEDAALLVLGAVGTGGAHWRELGSTAAELAARRSGAPMVVVRGEEPAQGPAPVVVGVDGSQVSERAIGFAFDFASRHGGELVAVHSLSDLPLDPYARVQRWELPWSEMRDDALEVLSESLAGWPEQYPDVPVRRVVAAEQPPRTLFDEAKGARLLVVGSHGRGRVRRLVLGSVSHAVVHHAPCPVAVLPAMA
ncbi:nucleotide-binding universal stress UspA family protein [Saccharopolyspora erythraea NRRL 2338]|uniref:Universal stress protein family n=2 Tax=Saccharopolyspora erythraea TaxID=1836 RepID=A4FCF9_SACEN|nr:universal stress protein [Saccharopolyspora erythraea]EQD83889.1 universal stress protein [Saccharopolyspora erythraea D]PFG95497.1 nucleotide-binding universal stress UspA family protein [Saccharopolyspora erythraea NRRL 2338]QRK92124.1 universal stress protein [Saccharopolyspora erythraea]CAM01734.1 universal stress protein family [Saccharopolyspora erythraea NRRL 2338]